MALTINGEKVEKEVIEQECKRLKPHYEKVFKEQTAEQQDQLWQWSKENVIEHVLIDQQARKEFPEITPGQIDKAYETMAKQYKQAGQDLEATPDEIKQQIRASLEAQIRTEKLISKVTADTAEPDKKQIEEFYQQHKEEYKRPLRVRVAHIIKQPKWQVTEEAAKQCMEEVKSKLDAGETFETLVPKYSDSADNGGDLGYISPGQMIEEFEAVVFNLSPGQVSDIFKTRFGYHIAKVYDRKEAEYVPLEQATDKIKQAIRTEAAQQKLNAYVDELKKVAQISETEDKEA